MTEPAKVGSGRLYVGEPGAALADMTEIGTSAFTFGYDPGEDEVDHFLDTTLGVDLSEAQRYAIFGTLDRLRPRPAYSVTVDSVESPLGPAPRKRRGLTGKRYRIARRRHARRGRDYRRGLIPSLHVRRHIPYALASAVPVPGRPGEVSLEFQAMQGARLDGWWLDEARDVSPRDAKPGYSEGS